MKRIAFAIMVVLLLVAALFTDAVTLPDWATWGLLIAGGGLIYTDVKRAHHRERLSLSMAMILLAILHLTWPEIAFATLIGLGLSQLVFTELPWNKRVYNVIASVTAAILVEWIYFALGDVDSTHSIIMTAITFDAVLALMYVPVWLRIGLKPLQILRGYLATWWIVPASAAVAALFWGAITIGPAAVYILAMALGMFAVPVMQIGDEWYDIAESKTWTPTTTTNLENSTNLENF